MKISVVLLGVERHKIRATCGSKLFDRVSSDVLKERLGVVVKIEDILLDSCLQWCGHVIHGDKSQVRGVMELEIVGKRKYKCPSELWEECLKNDMAGFGLKQEDSEDRERWHG